MAFLGWFYGPSLTKFQGPNLWNVDLNGLWTLPFVCAATVASWAEFNEPYLPLSKVSSTSVLSLWVQSSNTRIQQKKKKKKKKVQIHADHKQLLPRRQ